MKILNKLPRVYHLPFDLGMLKPGMNEIELEPSDEEKLLEHAQFRKDCGRSLSLTEKVMPEDSKRAPVRLPTPAPEESTSKKKGKKSAEVKSELADIPDSDALEIVANEDEVSRLQEYLLGEDRKAVKEAIAARIAVLKKG